MAFRRDPGSVTWRRDGADGEPGAGNWYARLPTLAAAPLPPGQIARSPADRPQSGRSLAGNGSASPFGQMIVDQPVADGNRPAGQDVRPQPAAMDEVFDDAGAGEALQVSACRAVLA